MGRIESVEGLVAVWGRALFSDDPLEALGEQGVTLGEQLRARLTAPQRNRVPTQARRRLLQRLREAGVARARLSTAALARLSTAALARPAMPTTLPDGEYDLIVGVRLTLIDEVLAGLQASLTWPRELDADDAGRLIDLGDLRDLSGDVPDTEGLEVGALHLPEPATTRAGGQGRLIVSQRFTLDLDVVADSFPRRTTVSTLDATLHFNAAVSVQQAPGDPERLAVLLGFLPADIEASTVEVEVGSPIQPRSASALREFASKIASGLVAAFLANRPTIVPNLRVPLGPAGGDVTMRLQRVDVRTSPSPGPGALVIGALIGTDPEPEPGTGSPDLLRLAPFSSPSVNASVRLHEVLLNKLAKEAVRTRALELPDIEEDKLGLDFELDIEVNDVDIDLRPLNRIHVTVDAKFVDFCGPGPFNFIDLDFDLEGSAQVAVFDERVRVIAPEDVSIDYDDSDMALCAVSSLIDVATVVFGVDLIGDVIVFGLVDLAIGNIDAIDLRRRGVFSLGRPIPGTELAPRLEVVQALVDRETLELLGNLTLEQDEDHVFIYVRVVNGPLEPFRPPSPVPRASVQVIDQDAPLIRETQFPDPGTTTRRIGAFEVTRTVQVIPPSTDEVLATAVTGDDGRARFVIDRRSVAGRVRVITTRERLGVPDPQPQTTVTEFPLIEQRPDIFFRVTPPGGPTFDSRRPGLGVFFSPNLAERRIGSPETPQLLVLFRDIIQ